MRFILVVALLGMVAAGGLFLLFGVPRVVEIAPDNPSAGNLAHVELTAPDPPETGLVAKEEILPAVPVKNSNEDIENQPPLSNPPTTVKAVYATGWSAGSKSRIDYLIKLIDETELNAIVIDIKDYSGFISYEIDSPALRESGALKEPRILKPNALLKRLHGKGIYVIGRISVFQDSVLARAHPEWALKASSTGQIWEDRKDLAWTDPASREVWGYNLLVARDALRRGFDEVNFDYIRFPSDGGLEDIAYPFWDGKRAKHLVMRDFFSYLRENLGEAAISADLFGLVTIAADDLGIGQKLDDALPYFDYVAPMVYPSHYAPGVFGYGNPAAFPYEVVKNSLEGALLKVKNYEFGIPVSSTSSASVFSTSSSSSTEASSTLPLIKVRRSRAKLRPWLQDFDLGADYDAAKVRAQIQASDEAGGVGWMLWDPKNLYTREAMNPEL